MLKLHGGELIQKGVHLHEQDIVNGGVVLPTT